MNNYSYNAVTIGDNTFIKGEIRSWSQKKAVSSLEKQGLIVVNIKAKSQDVWYNQAIGGRVSRADKIDFISQLHAFMDAGVSVDKALGIAAEQTPNKLLKKIIIELNKEVNNGQSISTALDKHRRYFPKYFSKMIKVGEESGTLSEILKNMLVQQEREYELISNARGAMIYPAILLLASLSIVVFMLSFVIPTIAQVLGDYGGELPWTTKLLIATSSFIVNHSLFLLAGLFSFILVFIAFAKQNFGKYFLESIFLKTPILKKIIIEYNIARIVRAMGTSIRSGLSIDRALRLAVDVTNNIHYQKSLEKSVVLVRKGVSLSEAWRGYPSLYPANVYGMIEIGEQTGKTEDMLERIAGFFERSVNNKLKNIGTTIEPFLIIFVGLLIMFIAVSILTPLWKFSETI